MEAGNTDDTYGQRMTALNELLKKVTERRTIVEFTIAEKVQKTYRIQSSSWKEAKEKIAVSEYSGDWDDEFADFDGDVFHHVDGSHDYIKSYAPQYEQKIRQVKIGYGWIDVEDLEKNPLYYLEVIKRWV